jgi:rod shape-determining protein MreC
MSAKPAQQRAPWILAALLLSQVILMSTNARRADSEQSMLRVWVMSAVTPIAGLVNRTASSIKGFFASYTDVRNAREENIALKDEIQKLTEELNTEKERSAQLDTLRAERALPELARYRQISANVVARDGSLWFRRLLIDRGTLDGVKKDMPVMSGGGIVGRVISLGPKFAMVQVITDKHAGLGAMLQSSRAMGEVHGMDNARCEMKSVSTTEQVREGESIVTTGLDRIYPKGLMVGTVERVEADPNAPWHKIIVKPAAPVDRAEHVQVLLIDQKDLKTDDPTKSG